MKKNMKTLILKELLFILAAWLLFLILFIAFITISYLTDLNSGIVVIGYLVWIIGLLIVGIKFIKKEDIICADYNISRLKLRLTTFLTIIIINGVFAIVIFPLGNYHHIPFEIYSEYDFLTYMMMAILFIVETILVLGIGYIIKAVKQKTSSDTQSI